VRPVSLIALRLVKRLVFFFLAALGKTLSFVSVVFSETFSDQSLLKFAA